MATADPVPRVTPADAGTRTAFLVVDTESVPDGRLLSAVKYPGLNLTPDEAIDRARRGLADRLARALPVSAGARPGS